MATFTSSIPWGELLGFAALWLIGWLCYELGRITERRRITDVLLGLAMEHREDVERRAR